ncbi:MAG: hypothetical protein HFJ02_04290 [Bacilli bacterium]|nr:hypothetical protein [Bacilli bacterium]
MQVKVDIPYPEVKVSSKNIKLAKEILSSYAGPISEDTAIHNYIFQYLILENEEIKSILKEIAIVEMHHLEILGELVKKLGLTPLYLSVNNDKTKWFSGEYVTYEKELKNILLDNIRNEELAIKNYEKIIIQTDDEYVKYILKRIILDEKMHIQVFMKLYSQVK